MKKATRVEYNPYTNRIDFKISQSTEGPWESLGESSDLLQYTGKGVLFSNCVSDIAETVNRFQNTVSDGLEIQFVGSVSDFDLLQKTACKAYNRGAGSGPLTCRHIAFYEDADDVIEDIKAGYARISEEFGDYLPGHEKYEDDGEAIGDSIVKFEETIGDAVPVCVIGNYSVGKSALINALIGEEVLPSKENPSTAKNVEIIRSDRYAMKINVCGEGQFEIEVAPGSLESSADGSMAAVFQEIVDKVDPAGKSEVLIIREVLDLLNRAIVSQEKGSRLAVIGWNVVVELPFRKSLLSDADNKIVFYDTPGSDNNEINHEEHDEALLQLMGSQTNALPILVTTRDQLVRKDTAEIRQTLDRYADNFASPCCLVVLTKCDLANRNKLEEGVPAGIKNWHGKTIILYTTPVGALGAKKGEGSAWLDASYRSDYMDWADKQSGSRRIVLPEYNIYPCEERGALDGLPEDKALYDTGIPSLEYEILYYIRHFGNYKKCERGRKDLLKAIESVKELLREQEMETAKAKRAAENKKAAERLRLIAELDEIRLPGSDGIADAILPKFSGDLDGYCACLSGVIGEAYDELADEDPVEMDKAVTVCLRAHCQENLIDVCYQREGGAKEMILDALLEQASSYADSLQAYVSKNDAHFSEFGRKALYEYLDKELEPPKFTDVKSVLDNLAVLFEKAALIRHGILKIASNPEKAKATWVNSKGSFFEGKLRGHAGLLGTTRGLFATALLDDPVCEYYKQLESWAGTYKTYIRGQLDVDNAVLSGMEEEIRALDAEVEDLRSRLAEISDVEEMLACILDPKEVEASDER